MTFPTLQFSFYSHTNEIRPILAFGQNSLNPLKGSFGEPRLHILGPLFLASHLFLI